MPNPTPPQADVDELACWIQQHGGGFNLKHWDALTAPQKTRNRILARRLLSETPSILKRYAKEAS